jgi:hypothetical protein
MPRTFKTGVCVLALLAALPDAGWAAHRPKINCAQPEEVTAIQTAVIQQELMDAALGCGQRAQENFNAFQTSYASELRRSDGALLRMFKRVQGVKRGDAAYNLFKTDMASKAEIRRVHGMSDFCAAADLVFAAALAPEKPSLSDLVSGLQIQDTNTSADDNDTRPVESCQMRVAVTLRGAEVAPNVVPKPKPDDLGTTPDVVTR